MNKPCLLAAAVAPILALSAAAQSSPVTVTNYVTVTVTNVITVTNYISAVPVPAAAPAANPAPVAAAAAAAATPAPAPVVMPKYPWQNSISVGLTLTRGNSDTMLFAADYGAEKKTPFNEYKVSLDAAYGDQNSTETVNDYKAAFQWNHLFTDRFFGYLRTDGIRDIVAEVDYRLTIGPGLGYYVIKNSNTTFGLEFGTAFEAQKLNGHDVETFDTVRLAENYERKFDGHARIWETAEILPQVDKLDNYVVNFEIGVETLLSKSFTLKTYLDDTFNNRPATGKLKNDIKLVSALGYKF